MNGDEDEDVNIDALDTPRLEKERSVQSNGGLGAEPRGLGGAHYGRQRNRNV
jgi:hypothetical protein